MATVDEARPARALRHAHGRDGENASTFEEEPDVAVTHFEPCAEFQGEAMSCTDCGWLHTEHDSSDERVLAGAGG